MTPRSLSPTSPGAFDDPASQRSSAMANLIRCVEGHIFDSDKGKCPVCGWTVPAVTAATGEPTVDATPAVSAASAPASQNTNGLQRSALFAALGAVSAAAVGIAIFFVVVKPKPAPAPPAPAHPAKPAANNAKGDSQATPGT